jgi:uncharacterized membrane protein YhhN
MPLLALYYVVGNLDINWWIFLGIIGGFGGDVLLMVIESDPNKSENYFTAGLISFLLGHIFYIVGLFQIADIMANFPLWGIALMLPYVGYAIIAGFILIPAVQAKDPEMKLPLTIYLTIIATMGVITVLTLGTSSGVVLLMLGAIMFMVSDSTLAYNKFKKEIRFERIIVMSTYIIAQFMIIQGVLLS